ncbi:hypothetical protein [Methanobrevibacter sp.]|uniref:hypothetical protein n=1 Tax=Methanobrevibacter sp. TaxID=66852 RepID=UPI0038907A48
MTDNDLFINISLELKRKLENLTDDEDKPIFKKVLLGFNENKVKIQGDGVVAICYVTGSSEYRETFGRRNIPQYITSVIGFVVRGSDEQKYLKAMRIKDFLRQTLEHDMDFYCLINKDGKRIVRNTLIMNTAVRFDAIATKTDILVAFDLRHHVYK